MDFNNAGRSVIAPALLHPPLIIPSLVGGATIGYAIAPRYKKS